MSHLKRLPAPKGWKIKRKENKFITKPHPGAHSLNNGLSLSTLLKYILGYAGNEKEVKTILNNKNIIVNGKRRKDRKFIVGLMDVLTIKEIEKNFRLINKKGKIDLIEIDDDESKIKPYKINNKRKVRKGVQLNLSSGENIIVNDKDYSIGDTLILKIPEKKIINHIKFEVGCYVYVTKGKHIGRVGVVKDVKDKNIIVEINKEPFEIKKENIFVIGKDKPAIKLE